MRIPIKSFWPVLIFLAAASARSEVIINGTTNNGGFVNATSGYNATSLTGWTASKGVWVSSGNSVVDTDPFGADTATNSHFIQIHNDSGEVLTSTAVFSVAPNDVINLSLDYFISGTDNPKSPTLTITLWDSVANTTYATLGTISTATAKASFSQMDYTVTATTANNNLCLRLTLASAGGVGKDVNIDRVYLAGGTITPPEPIVYATKQYLLGNDTSDRIIEKAAKTLPRANQVTWQRDEFTFFTHFGVNTFNGVEWGTGNESPSVFNPTNFDADQWVREMRDAGGKMLVLVAKHHDGFCLFPSRYTAQDVASSPWMAGTGNVVGAVATACQKYGLKLGLYLSPADLFQIGDKVSRTDSNYYGNGSTAVPSTIPTNPSTFISAPTQGRTPPAGFSSYSYTVDDYNRYFLNQLYELLTEYGDVVEVWFDGANPDSSTSQTYNESAWFDLIAKLRPNALVAVGGPDIRWVGNETGTARTTEWSPLPKPISDSTATDLGSRSKLTAGSTVSWYPAEADTKILSGWFWKSSHSVKDTSALLGIYYTSVGRNANLLLNLSPDTTGQIPSNQLTSLRPFGQIVRNTFAINLASNAVVTAPADSLSSAALLNDGDLDTFWEAAASTSTADLIFDLPSAATINVVALQEPIAQRGQRIEGFSIDTWSGSAWVNQGTGTTIGHKRLIKFTAAVTTSRVRIQITACRLNPSLAEVGFYKEAVSIAAPTISDRNASGQVTISGTAGLTLRYTTNGAAPDTSSPMYAGAIDMPLGGVVNAASFGSDGLPGLIATKTFSSVSSAGWSATSDGDSGANAAGLATDESSSTYWQSAATALPHSLVVDLGRVRCIGGFTYLPVSTGGAGTVKTYRFETSADNITWTTQAEGEFGNIQYSPVLQSVTFSPVMARYVRFTALSEIFGNNTVKVPEIGVIPAGFDAWRRDRSLQTASVTADPDANGLSALLEYASVVEPGGALDAPVLEVYLDATGQMRMRIRQRTGMTDVSVILEGNEDLSVAENWQTANQGNVLSSQSNGDGSSTVERSLVPDAGADRGFYRLRYELK